jgi:DNA-binding PadR family transcriptional regulator
VVEQGNWEIGADQELYTDLNVVRDTTNRSGWIGHLVRMDHGRAPKKIFESKPEGRERMGRPRQRWSKYLEKDPREMLGKRWWQKIVNTAAWSSASKDARGLYSQELSK